MGRYSDFTIANADGLSSEQLTREIFQHIFIRRIKSNKPCVIVLTGQSGEGKSWDALKIGEVIGELSGYNFTDYIDDIVVYTPLEYPTKMKRLLEAPELKMVNLCILDEARNVVSARTWQSFANQAIADIQATSRAVKPLITILITQSMGDIDLKMRKAVQFYGVCTRPMGESAQMRLYALWTDDRDLGNITLRKRRVKGHLILKGRYVMFRPTEFVFRIPSKETTEKYEGNSFRAKSKLIRYKLDQLFAEMKKEYKGMFTRVNAAVEVYTQNPKQLEDITKRIRGKIKLRPEIKEMLGFSDSELQEFESKIGDHLKKLSMAGMEAQEKQVELESQELKDKVPDTDYEKAVEWMGWGNYGKGNSGTDIESEDAYEINPTVYANQIIKGIIEAPIKALEGGKPFDEGLYSYTLGVENLELLCRANHWIGGEHDTYDEDLKKKVLEMKADLDKENVMARKDAKISKIKFELLLTRILDTRMKEGKLKV